jgi:hypothetical protein
MDGAAGTSHEESVIDVDRPSPSKHRANETQTVESK